MENTGNGVTTMTPSAQSKAMDNKGADQRPFTYVLECSIRRRPSLVGLPGTDPNDRIYKIGSSLDARTKKNLKGIDEELELKFMPSIIGVSANTNDFQERINEYWGNIGIYIPADESFLIEELRGRVIKLRFTIIGEERKRRIDEEIDIEKKMKLLSNGIVKDIVTIEHEDVPDFILLSYALKYSRVAKDISLLDKSPKIHFYIYSKNTAVKVKLTAIELRSKAIAVFTEIKDNEEVINQLLVMTGDLPTNYTTLDDKIIALDAWYNKSLENMERFVKFYTDSDLELKYIIKYAVQKGKLQSPANTDSYYYGQVLLGRTLYDAVLYLRDEGNSEAVSILNTLKKEIKD